MAIGASIKNELAVYTKEFWLRAIELTLQATKMCEKCGELDGNIPFGKKKPIAVNVGLRAGESLTVGNLRLFCTACKRGKYQVKMKREELDKLIYPMFVNP